MSIFAFGGAVMLKVGLASQNLAIMFVNGLELMASDCIKQGNHIGFGNGNNGQITNIGWFQTTLKH
jgi:small-conductance mechanosensitive channel